MGYLIQKILAFFEIAEAKKKKVKAIWYPLFITLGLILIAACVICFIVPHYLDKTLKVEEVEFLKQEFFVAFLVIISNILVGYNTNMFISDADDIIIGFISTSSNEPDKVKLKKYNSIFKWVNKITFAFSFTIILFYTFNIFGFDAIPLEFLFNLNEGLIIAMFFSFCVADYYMILMLKIVLPTNPNDKSLIALNNFTKSAFPLIDIAGCIGAALIGILSFLFHRNIHEHFSEGFAIGALAFHIIFTQINFAYLKTVEIKESV